MKKITPVVALPADLSTLPAVPVPPDLDLRHFDCMHLNTERLLKADIWRECTDAEIATALRFWAAAWQQVPCGSLPNDDAILREIARCDGRNKRWRAVRLGALRGFELCIDGRLYHHAVVEAALSAARKSRAGSRGAIARWNGPNALENNETSDATAYGKRNGRTHGTVNGKRHGRSDGKTMQRREGIYLPPTPVLATAGPDVGLGGPPGQPDPRPESTEAHGVEDRSGRVCVHFPEFEPGKDPDYFLWVDRHGIVDAISTVRDAPSLSFVPAEALLMRRKASEEINAQKQRTTDSGGNANA